MTRSLPPMITARALGSMPEFIEDQIGPSALDRVISRSRLPYRVLDQRDVFIPETMLVAFLDNAAREAAEDRLGLLIAPHLTVADYDLWGSYVLGAPTLRESLLRVVGSIGLHSNDSVAISVIDDATIKFTYDFGMRNEAGYEQIAPCAVGVISSIFKFYLGASWRPLAIDLDFPEPHDPFVFEDAFECPVHFGKPAVAVWFARQHLDAARPVEHAPFVTTADIERKRFGGTPTSATDKVMQLIMLQMLDGAPDLDDAAENMKIGPRTLQRALLSEGTSFRELANAAVAERSRELLADSHLSVTEIAADLGYSSSAHFARAFRKQSGQSPSEFRTRWGARKTEPNAT